MSSKQVFFKFPNEEWLKNLGSKVLGNASIQICHCWKLEETDHEKMVTASVLSLQRPPNALYVKEPTIDERVLLCLFENFEK